MTNTYTTKNRLMAHKGQIDMTNMTPFEIGEYIACGPGTVTALIDAAALVAAALNLQDADYEAFAEGFMHGRDYMLTKGAA